jgi:AcrR family transcriptional regulator
MLDAGRALLVDRPLEELSVGLICQHAGTTVGAFYGRFENKLAFFVTMQRILSLRSEMDLREFVSRHEVGTTPLEQVCHEVVLYTVNVFRTNFGVLRASLQHTREGMYDIHKAASERNRPVFSEQLNRRLKHVPLNLRRRRVDFAYQAMVGTLVHTVLNDPGPLSLYDNALVDELSSQMLAYVEHGHPR